MRVDYKGARRRVRRASAGPEGFAAHQAPRDQQGHPDRREATPCFCLTKNRGARGCVRR
jgi:hypothetical protein